MKSDDQGRGTGVTGSPAEMTTRAPPEQHQTNAAPTSRPTQRQQHEQRRTESRPAHQRRRQQHEQRRTGVAACPAPASTTTRRPHEDRRGWRGASGAVPATRQQHLRERDARSAAQHQHQGQRGSILRHAEGLQHEQPAPALKPALQPASKPTRPLQYEQRRINIKADATLAAQAARAAQHGASTSIKCDVVSAV